MTMDTELRQLLFETAIVGAGYGWHEEAETILAALELNGGQPLPVATGRALSLISQGFYQQAADQLTPHIDRSGKACEADALMALLTLKQGRASEAEHYLNRCEQVEGVLSDMARGLRQDFRGGISHSY